MRLSGHCNTFVFYGFFEMPIFFITGSTLIQYGMVIFSCNYMDLDRKLACVKVCSMRQEDRESGPKLILFVLWASAKICNGQLESLPTTSYALHDLLPLCYSNCSPSKEVFLCFSLLTIDKTYRNYN